jgi:hypothetical protein
MNLIANAFKNVIGEIVQGVPQIIPSKMQLL